MSDNSTTEIELNHERSSQSAEESGDSFLNNEFAPNDDPEMSNDVT